MGIIRDIKSYLGPQGEKVEVLTAINPDTLEIYDEETFKEQETNGEPRIIYAGVATLMSSIPNPSNPAGDPLPIVPNEVHFPIQANSLQEAINRYGEELQTFMNKLKEEEQKQQQQSQAPSEEIYVPSPGESEAINNLKNTGEH